MIIESNLEYIPESGLPVICAGGRNGMKYQFRTTFETCQTLEKQGWITMDDKRCFSPSGYLEAMFPDQPEAQIHYLRKLIT